MRRRRFALVAGGLLVLVAAAVAAALALGDTEAPADGADALVPDDALAYVHVSTDPDRQADAELLERVERFPSFARLRAEVEDALQVDLAGDVRPWLGGEAAVAVLPEGVVALLAVGERRRAADFLDGLDGTDGAIVGDFVAIGPAAPVEAVRAVHAGDGRALSELPAYARAAEERPDDRAADAWASATAAEALPERFAGVLAGHPWSGSVVPTGDGVRLVLRRSGGAADGPEFDPELVDTVPRDALAYVGLRGLRPLGPLLPPAAGAAGPRVAAAVQPLLDTLTGEVALSISPGEPDPVTTLTARTNDPAAARSALAGLQSVIAQVLVGSEDTTGAVPTFQERDVGGLSAYALTLAGGGELVYAVDGTRVVISNADAGIERGVRGEDGLPQAEPFREVVPDVPDPAEALAFLDASQLLDLADDAGLDASATYRAARPDLEMIRAIGASVRRQGTDIITELNLTFP